MAADVFTELRPVLFAIAYQVLGTRHDADDAVQESWLRWNDADQSVVRNPRAYLARTVTRTALNLVRTAARRREVYPGPWLPEPLTEDTPETRLMARANLSHAVSALLQQMGPEQRAAVVLHDAFGFSYAEVAEVMDRSEASVRQLVSRAKRRLHAEAAPVLDARTHQATDAFLQASLDGDLDRLLDLLAPGVVALSDGGGQVFAARKPVIGAQKVALFVKNIAANAVPGTSVVLASLNGHPGVTASIGGVLALTLSLELDAEGRISAVFLVVNPEKLGRTANR